MKDRGIWNEQNIISDSHFTVSQEVVLFLVSQQQFGPLREAVRLQWKRHWRSEHSEKLPGFKHLNRVFFKTSLSEKNFASSFVASRTFISRKQVCHSVEFFLGCFQGLSQLGASVHPSVHPPLLPWGRRSFFQLLPAAPWSHFPISCHHVSVFSHRKANLTNSSSCPDGAGNGVESTFWVQEGVGTGSSLPNKKTTTKKQKNKIRKKRCCSWKEYR